RSRRIWRPRRLASRSSSRRIFRRSTRRWRGKCRRSATSRSRRHHRDCDVAPGLTADASARAVTRHLTATLAYRAAKVLRDAPPGAARAHAGRLAMLRGMAGVPVRPESYARAEIVAGRVGREQTPPGVEFDGDASAR